MNKQSRIRRMANQGIKEDLARRNAIYISVTYKEMINNISSQSQLENLINTVECATPEDLRNLDFSKMTDEELKSFLVNTGSLIKAHRDKV